MSCETDMGGKAKMEMGDGESASVAGIGGVERGGGFSKAQVEPSARAEFSR